jgi:hypothetical protein
VARPRGLGLGVALLGLGLCGGAQAQGTGQFDGQYVGALTLQQVVGGDCTQPPPGALYPLRISGGRVHFLYTPRFNTMLKGRVHADGSFTAFKRLRKGAIRMTGRIAEGSVTAELRSPSCGYTFKTQD